MPGIEFRSSVGGLSSEKSLLGLAALMSMKVELRNIAGFWMIGWRRFS